MLKCLLISDVKVGLGADSKGGGGPGPGRLFLFLSPYLLLGPGNPVVKEIGRGSAMAAVMGSRAVFSENVTGARPQLDLMNEEGLPRVQAAGGEF